MTHHHPRKQLHFDHRVPSSYEGSDELDELPDDDDDADPDDVDPDDDDDELFEE